MNPPGRRRNEANQRQNSVNAGRQRRDSAREVANKRTTKRKERKIVKRKVSVNFISLFIKLRLFIICT